MPQDTTGPLFIHRPLHLILEHPITWFVFARELITQDREAQCGRRRNGQYILPPPLRCFEVQLILAGFSPISLASNIFSLPGSPLNDR